MNSSFGRLGSALAVAALLTLTACSNGSAPEGAPDTDTTPSASASPTKPTEPTEAPVTQQPDEAQTAVLDEETGQFDFCDPKKQPPFTGAAADKFGAKNVMDAYCSMVELQMSQSFIPSMLKSKPEDLEPIQFSRVAEHMTASAREEWDETVKKAIAGGEAAARSAWAFVGFDAVSGSGYHFMDDGPLVLNQRYSPATTQIDTTTGRPRLGMKFTVSADYNVVKDGTDDNYLFPLDREISIYLLPNPDKDSVLRWYIDAWYVQFWPGKPKKVGTVGASKN